MSSMEECAAMGKVGPEHESIARFAGTWRAEVKLWFDPAGEPTVSQGTMKNTLVLGGRFLHQDYHDDAGMFEGKGYWGYNTVDKRYEGFWIDSMATFFQLEHGQHDAQSDTYTMIGSMTNPQTGQPMKKKSVIRVKNPNEHSLEMFFEVGGHEARSMVINYKRA